MYIYITTLKLLHVFVKEVQTKLTKKEGIMLGKNGRIHDVNDQAALNNNIGSSTLQMNPNIARQHEKPKTKSELLQNKGREK